MPKPYQWTHEPFNHLFDILMHRNLQNRCIHRFKSCDLMPSGNPDVKPKHRAYQDPPRRLGLAPPHNEHACTSIIPRPTAAQLRANEHQSRYRSKRKEGLSDASWPPKDKKRLQGFQNYLHYNQWVIWSFLNSNACCLNLTHVAEQWNISRGSQPLTAKTVEGGEPPLHRASYFYGGDSR